MPYIETVDDIVEELADNIGVYGAHSDATCFPGHLCRVCWTSQLHDRLVQALENEKRLNGSEG